VPGFEILLLIEVEYCSVNRCIADGCMYMAGSSGLPPNWEKRLDENTGRYYYVNHATKHTQWQPPPGQCLATELKLIN